MIRLFHLNILKKIFFFVLVSCWIGITAGVQDDDDDEIEWLKISEGENLTDSIQINKSDEDPQVLVTRLKGSSQERIAHLICHNGDCEHECWISGVPLVSDGQNVTLILKNVRYNQTGLYKISKLSSRHPENKSYNVTVYHPPFSTISPEQPAFAMYSKSFTAEISTGAVVLSLVVIIAAVIGFVYSKHRKVAFNEVPQKINSVACRWRRCLSDSSL